jgi:hypothetical protein
MLRAYAGTTDIFIDQLTPQLPEIYAWFPQCAPTSTSSSSSSTIDFGCLDAAFLAIDIYCVLDNGMNTGGNYCPYNVLPEQMGLYHSLSTITIDADYLNNNLMGDTLYIFSWFPQCMPTDWSYIQNGDSSIDCLHNEI